MKTILTICFLAFSGQWLHAQDATPERKIHDYYLFTDVVYDIESIPNIGYEHFFLRHNKLKSWQASIAYQVHFNDQFGFVFSHGDRISIGVYQGPVARFGYCFYKTGRRRNWLKYYAPGLGLKYLWYDNERVNTGKRMTDKAYRVQSEHCLALVPQFVIGAKRANKHFCADFYFGLQMPIKFREKTVSLEQDSYGHTNPHVPYHIGHVGMFPAPIFGIKLGLLK